VIILFNLLNGISLVDSPKRIYFRVAAGKGGSTPDSVSAPGAHMGNYFVLWHSSAPSKGIWGVRTPQADRHYYRFEGALPTIGTNRVHPKPGPPRDFCEQNFARSIACNQQLARLQLKRKTLRERGRIVRVGPEKWY